MKYRVSIEQDEDGFFVVETPDLPGCVSQGKTREEALENIKDAIKAYTLRQSGAERSWSTSFEETVIDIDV